MSEPVNKVTDLWYVYWSYMDDDVAESLLSLLQEAGADPASPRLFRLRLGAAAEVLAEEVLQARYRRDTPRCGRSTYHDFDAHMRELDRWEKDPLLEHLRRYPSWHALRLVRRQIETPWPSR